MQLVYTSLELTIWFNHVQVEAGMYLETSTVLPFVLCTQITYLKGTIHLNSFGLCNRIILSYKKEFPQKKNQGAISIKGGTKSDMVAHTLNSSAWKAESRGLL